MVGNGAVGDEAMSLDDAVAWRERQAHRSLFTNAAIAVSQALHQRASDRVVVVAGVECHQQRRVNQRTRRGLGHRRCRRRLRGLGPEDRGGDRDDREADEPTGRSTRHTNRVCEDQQQPAFDRRRARHTERSRRRPHRCRLASEIQQERRIGRRPCTKPQHFVVARPLAFARESGSGKPDEGIEPIDRARQLRHRLCAPVAALDVRELVHQRSLPRVSGPRRSRRRHHDDRRKQSGNVRARIAVQLADCDIAAQAKAPPDQPRLIDP